MEMRLERIVRKELSPICDSEDENMDNAMKSMKKLQKEAEVAVQFFHEVLRVDKAEMLTGCTNAVFDAVLPLIENSKSSRTLVLESLLALLEWAESRICSDGITSIADKGNGMRLAATLLEHVLLNDSVDSTPEHQPRNVTESEHLNRQSQLSSSTDSGFFTDLNSSICSTNIASGRLKLCGTEPTIDDLLSLLNLREVEKFNPVFPDIENDDSDTDDNPVIDEERDERTQKRDKKTCEEEIRKTSDGGEIRRKKLSTFNVEQTSKHVTIKTRIGAGPERLEKFDDDDFDFDQDTQTEEFFKRPFGQSKKRLNVSTDSPFRNRLKNLNLAGDNVSQMIRSLDHSDETTQNVSRIKRRNGKIVADNAAQKLDSFQLKAEQIDTFMDDELVDREGNAFSDEKSIVKEGPASSINLPPPIPPKRRHVVQYMQTFGDKENNEKDEFFRGATLSSYIALNDNLRYQEEQYRRKIQFEFAHPRDPIRKNDFSNLSQILQVAESDRIRLPKRYVNEPQKNASLNTEYPVKSEIDEAEVLEQFDASDWLVLRAKDNVSKPNEVRGGPVDALIAYATQTNVSLLYQEAFLTTYRTFISSKELIQKLIRRYNCMNSAECQSKIKIARQSFSMLVRVVDELSAFEFTQDLIFVITSFIYCMIRNGNYIFAKILRKRLMSRLEPRLLANKIGLADYSKCNSKQSKSSTIFEFRSSSLAKQMTYLDAKLFQQIEPVEMLWWAIEQDEKKSPNLCLFTEHFNKVSYWVRTLVIKPSDQKVREKYLMKFVKIMKQLRVMGNYNSYLAILSALDSGPIRRLDWSKYASDALKEHSVVMDSSHSFRNYRTLLSESLPPCLPYIGLVLQDLTFVQIGNSHFLPPEQCNGKTNLVNYGKRWQQFAILDSIRRFKIWNYSIEKDEKVLQFFQNFKNYLSEDDIWELSETIKPRLRKNK